MEFQLGSPNVKPGSRYRPAITLSLLAAVSAVAACTSSKSLGLNPTETLTQGYVIDQQQIDLVPVGSSREQVILPLAAPPPRLRSTTRYSITSHRTRKRPVAFLNPHIVDQRVLAVYFGKDSRVSSISNYGLKDGKVFDFISRTTPTGGKDQNFIGQMIAGVGKMPGSLPGASQPQQ